MIEILRIMYTKLFDSMCEVNILKLVSLYVERKKKT